MSSRNERSSAPAEIDTSPGQCSVETICADLIPLIYQGPLHTPPWTHFLRALRLKTDCDAAALCLRATEAGRPASVIYEHDGFFRTSPLDDGEVVRTMLKMEHPLRNALKKAGDIYTTEDVISREAFVKTEFYQNALHRIGVEHEVGMIFMEPTGWSASLGLMNGEGKPAFGTAEKTLLAACLPHLEFALEIHARMRRHETENLALKSALNRLKVGTFLLDGSGKILDINDTGQDIVHRHGDILVRAGRLTFARRADNDRLRSSISTILARRLSEPDGHHDIALRIEGGDAESYGILISPIPITDSYQNDNMPSAIIFLRDAACQQSVPEHLVTELFGLIPSEARLAALLIEGFTLVEAAEKLSLTETTARTYASRIFGKTGINRQADLTRLFLNSVATLGVEQQEGAARGRRTHR
jgi:DNA-binding CsgD family transcriptional regulator